MKTQLRETKSERIARFYERMSQLGLSYAEIETLRKAQLTLHRWAELECGDSNNYSSWSIERDETDKPFKCVYPHSGKSYRIPVADREKGALRRVAAIIEAANKRIIQGRENPLWFYHQTDPRGCALFIGRTYDIIDSTGHPNVEQNYNRGIAVCI